MKTNLFKSICLAVFAVSPFLTASANASDYPSKMIRIVVAWSAGTGTDLNARNIGQQITAATGQPVVVENKPGADGSVGTAEVLRAPADGYTVLATSNAHVANLFLMKNLPYDALNDFVPVAGTRKLPGLLIASPRLGIKNLAELTALAKRNPGKISFAAGTSSGRIGMEIYQQMASIRLLHIPYKSNTPALNDLLGGHVDVMLADIVNSLPYIKAGRVVPLAAAAKTRFKILPDLPTVAESGLAGYDVQPWTGLWVRKGTSPEAIAFLNKFANRASMAEREQVEASGAEPFITTPEEFARHIENEVAVWKRAVVAAKITPD